MKALKNSFTLLHPLRVRWAECDAQGIVFNVNYFLYFDVAMTEWLRAAGFQGDKFMDFFTVHAEADYKGSAKFDDMLEIGARCVKLGRTSMTVETAIFRNDELLTTGKLVYVHADPKSQEKSPLPDDFVEKVLAFEKTAPTRG
ncbi:acyl-CoA thioesterase [Hyphococcus luteus]|uniref:acyl-CoA thioesterase n=1 Tax=Hyphococcus luteus TaxID=2058213 RepID=UPI003C6D3900